MNNDFSLLSTAELCGLLRTGYEDREADEALRTRILELRVAYVMWFTASEVERRDATPAMDVPTPVADRLWDAYCAFRARIVEEFPPPPFAVAPTPTTQEAPPAPSVNGSMVPLWHVHPEYRGVKESHPLHRVPAAIIDKGRRAVLRGMETRIDRAKMADETLAATLPLVRQWVQSPESRELRANLLALCEAADHQQRLSSFTPDKPGRVPTNELRAAIFATPEEEEEC